MVNVPSCQIGLCLYCDMNGIKRDLFPIVEEKPYFNSCSIGPLATPVKEAIDQFTQDWNSHGGFAWVMEDGWNVSVEEARNRFATIIGADPENIAYSFGNSVAFSSILSGFEFTSGDNILYNTLDFPSFPTYLMARAEGSLDYRVVQDVEGLVKAADYEKHIDAQTQMLTACEVSSNTGARIDVDALTEIAHSNDVPVFIDTYQSTGVIPMDVKKQDIDFLASGCLKWLVGGFGISFLYIRDDWLDALDPKSIGWMGVQEPFEDLYDKLRTRLHRPDTATKFQYGTPYPFGAVTASAGMQIIKDIGVKKIFEYDMNITQLIIEEAQNRGMEVQTSPERAHRGSIVNIAIENATEVVIALQEKGFILDMRSNGIRIAPHFFNNKNDIYRLFEGIEIEQKKLS